MADVSARSRHNSGRKGRGHALRAAWARSRADVVAYMDADLSTDLGALPALLLPLLACRTDVAIGSRLAPGAGVTRGLKRELTARLRRARAVACAGHVASLGACEDPPAASEREEKCRER
jgi:glycosyltransferase involved in cell wall biosynthesis